MKFIRSTCFLIISVLLFSSCTAMRDGKNSRDLNYQKYPIDVNGIMTYDGREYSVNIKVPESGNMSVTVLSPERIAGAVFTVSGGSCSARLGDTVYEMSGDGYSASHGIFLVSEMFSLDAKQFSGSEITVLSGVKYSCSEYRTRSGTVTVYIQSGLSRPDRMEAVLNGRQISFAFAPEE